MPSGASPGPGTANGCPSGVVAQTTTGVSAPWAIAWHSGPPPVPVAVSVSAITITSKPAQVSVVVRKNVSDVTPAGSVVAQPPPSRRTSSVTKAAAAGVPGPPSPARVTVMVSPAGNAISGPIVSVQLIALPAEEQILRLPASMSGIWKVAPPAVVAVTVADSNRGLDTVWVSGPPPAAVGVSRSAMVMVEPAGQPATPTRTMKEAWPTDAVGIEAAQ